MNTEWLDSNKRSDLLEQLEQDLAEFQDRVKHECEDIIIHAIDSAYEIGVQDGEAEAQADE